MNQAPIDQPVFWGVIPAGGSGQRFSRSLEERAGIPQDKLLADLNGEPVLLRSVRALLECPAIQGVVVVASGESRAAYQEALAPVDSGQIRWASGGKTRRDSVYSGLQALPDEATHVVIHDGARPLIEPQRIERCLSVFTEPMDSPVAGAVIGLPVTDTLKRASSLETYTVAEGTVDREKLWRVQTPQVFPVGLLKKAHASVSTDVAVTDDAQLMEMNGYSPVLLIPGSERNIKITVAEDLVLASFWFSRQS